MADRLDGKFGPTDSGDPVTITPSDSADLPNVLRALVVPTAGTIKVTNSSGVTSTLSFPVGGWPVRVKKVWATPTPPTDIWGIE
jgi:hypothetical protein